MIDVFVLWFVVTLEPGHLRHIQMDDRYPTLEACEADRPELQRLIETEFPGDEHLRTYCQPFTKEEPLGQSHTAL